MRRRESQTQFLLRASQNFGATLPFSDEFALAILKSGLATGSLRPDWQYHVTLNCFDGSAHVFLSFLLVNPEVDPHREQTKRKKEPRNAEHDRL